MKSQLRSSFQRLLHEPHTFDFFQAVRLIELANCSPRLGRKAQAKLVGQDFDPAYESVRFRAVASQSFPGSEIADLFPGKAAATEAPLSLTHVPLQMVVTFMGLTGPSGVLPQHYTQRLIDELREDRGMLEFFDIFNHRIIAHFYRAWKKYHFAFSYETYALRQNQGHERGADEPFTQSLYCLTGMGTGGLRGQQKIPDEGLLYYAGLFAHYPRNAVSLERLISDYYRLPTEVLQFQGQWMWLSVSEQSRLSGLGENGADNNQLGVTAIAGERVWGIESKFCVRLGPLSYAEFWELTPGGRELVPLSQLIRSYVGSDFDFEVQPVLRRDEVPPCELRSEAAIGPHLGWNCWIRSQPMQHDAQEAVFQVDGMPAL